MFLDHLDLQDDTAAYLVFSDSTRELAQTMKADTEAEISVSIDGPGDFRITIVARS